MSVSVSVKFTLSVNWSVSIDTVVNFDGDSNRHKDGDCTCKQALKANAKVVVIRRTKHTEDFRECESGRALGKTTLRMCTMPKGLFRNKQKLNAITKTILLMSI